MDEGEDREQQDGDEDGSDEEHESNAAAIVAFYKQHGCAPRRRGQSGSSSLVCEREHKLARSLYIIRAMAQQHKSTESIRLLQQGAPKLMKAVVGMAAKAHECVEYLKSQPSATDPVARKWHKFIANRRAEINAGKRDPGDEVCCILSTGLPGCLDPGKKRGTSTATLRALITPWTARP